MKINLIKTANNKLWPADEEAEEKLSKLKAADIYVADVKINQNYELHKRIFAFFAFCTNFYYGDMEAQRDEFKVKFVRNKLTVIAGYYRQVFARDGVTFELLPLSLSYASMSPEERQVFYKKITDAALKRVFDKTTDQNVINQLLGFF